MHNAVSDCIDLIERLDYTVPRIGERINHKFYSHCVIWHRRLDRYLVFSCGRVCEQTPINANALAQSLCEYCLRVTIDQLVFERGAPTVDD